MFTGGSSTTISTEATSRLTTAFPQIDTMNYNEQSLSYILVPICSLVVIGILTVTVILLIKRKRRIDRLRHHLMPFYNFAPGEEEDWETELIESEGETQHTRRGMLPLSITIPINGSLFTIFRLRYILTSHRPGDSKYPKAWSFRKE